MESSTGAYYDQAGRLTDSESNSDLLSRPFPVSDEHASELESRRG